MSREEIDDFVQYFHKFAERCQMTSLVLRDGKDPNDEQWDILEEVHRIWYEGSMPIFRTVMDEPDKKADQKGLFVS